MHQVIRRRGRGVRHAGRSLGSVCLSARPGNRRLYFRAKLPVNDRAELWRTLVGGWGYGRRKLVVGADALKGCSQLGRMGCSRLLQSLVLPSADSLGGANGDINKEQAVRWRFCVRDRPRTGRRSAALGYATVLKRVGRSCALCCRAFGMVDECLRAPGRGKSAPPSHRANEDRVHG